MRHLYHHNTAFFSTCNNAYIPRSIAALLSIRNFIPKAKLFIFSRNISEHNKAIMKKLNISFFDLDLRGDFYRHWQYPVECYYLFAAPEVLLSQGFKYSLYIDGDVLCTANPLKNIGRIQGVAGLTVGDCRGVFLDDFDTLQKAFNLSSKQTTQPRIASGVVYFNNKAMNKIDFYNIAKEYFKKCLDLSAPRKGDDSLFSLIQITKLPPEKIKDLGKTYNFMTNLYGYNIPPDTTFLHLSQNKPWNSYTLSPKQQDYQYITTWRHYFTTFSKPIWTEEYQQEITAKKKAEEQKLLKHLKYFEQLSIIPSSTSRIQNHKKPPLHIFISEDQNLGITNFGDEIQKDIIPIIFGYRVIPTSHASEASIFTVGSILSELTHMTYDKTNHIWGSGFISSEPIPNETDLLKKVTIHALRGKITYSRIKSQLKNLPDLPLGDPGLLASIIYPKSAKKNHKIGLVHHYIDADNAIVSSLRKNDNFLIINPLDPPKEVAAQISSCDFILSSSLHGLIVADSYNIPNAHIKLSDKVYGGEYKFNDYDSGVNKTHLEADTNKIHDLNYINTLKSQYQPIKNLRDIQKTIIAAFPKI